MNYLPSAAPDSLPGPPFGEPVWEIATLFPPQGEWTERDYLALGTNRLIELSDGCLEFLPMPTLYHQFLVRYLFARLDEFVKGLASGHVLFAPLPVHLWSGKFREPDILYLQKARLKKLHAQPEGADLVMEIVSPGDENRNRDLDTKREEYAAAGIAEYWIVDPEKRTITVLALDGESYRVHGEFGIDAEATSVLLPGFKVTVADAFAAAEDVG